MTGSQVETWRRWCASSRVGDGADAAAVGRPRRSTCPLPAPRRDPPTARGRPARATCRATADGLRRRPDAPRTLAALPRGPRRGRGPAGVDVVGRRDRAAHPLRRPRRAEPQPPGRRAGQHRAARPHRPRALPPLPAEPRRRARRPARAVPRPPGRGARPLRRRPTSTGRPSWRTAVFRIFLAQQRVADRRAGGARRCWTAGSPSRRPTPTARRPPAPSWSAWSAPPSVRFPVVGDLARSRPLPLVRPAAGGRRARRRRSPACATRWRRWRPTRTRPTRASGSTRWPPSPSDRAASSPQRLAAGRPGARADARGAGPQALRRLRPGRRARVTVDGRAVVTARLPAGRARRRGSCRTVGRSDELAAGGPLATAGRRRSWPRGARATTAVVELYVAVAGRRGRRAGRRRRAAPRLSGWALGRRRPTRSRWRVCTGGRRRSSTCTFRSDERRRAWPRTSGSAACTPWWSAGWTCGGCASSTSPGCRPPRTCCCSSASPEANPDDRRLVAMAQVRQLAVGARRRRPAASACRTPSARSRTASRRSGGRGPPAARPAASST